ncbi:four-carbon acid sugar kinase family protein [Sphingobacterium gobiense]|uniref:Four-carbon acid sugar kinase N-terminal domain-containing protein n=1 Tax=Sphingobacterium gobiense TaxID=1382456 RepID=A0A2S9JLZ3_9SPHI|nr:four-carbon acid sugar kinase family protein [Sphingobacterium gobiense]PRD54162.1 hypothetical protein C5749_11795 [Sphingobacterium gobiense]
MAILVIADDLTGAAEIGGMVLRYGLSVEIVHTLTLPISKDVRILNTNTRSLKADEALLHLQGVFLVDQGFKWDWIYLKFDSALRGHIKEEISFYRTIFQKDNVIFCPVNPALGRIIEDGVYWVNGRPIAETDFAQDPEFPITKSHILEVLDAKSWHMADDVKTLSTAKPSYIVPAVKDEAGLNSWASIGISFGICAGGAAFFDALLRRQIERRPVSNNLAPLPQTPVLYVCGSRHESSIERIATVNTDKVVYWAHIGEEEEVAKTIRRKMDKYGKVILAVAPTVRCDAAIVREHIAQVLAILYQEYALHELIIEGGATARAILEVLGIDTLVPIWEYGQGVIRNHVPEVALTVTLKPGSYPWTEELWVF